MEREAVEAMLREKARRLLESISVSETARDEAAAAFASMDRRMAAVDEAMRPAQVRPPPIPSSPPLVAWWFYLPTD